ncbi:unnamed protein product [Linum tenue]|uniref:Uncharacterized protein n=1 Tax=Linum tenue TaxID=586396 RepID=A0AAV0HCR9_9ROSI|nr:unnamed protein product [Linum tenue]
MTTARATPSDLSLRIVSASSSALSSDSRLPVSSSPITVDRRGSNRLPPPIKISRRDAALLPFVALVPLLAPPPPAAAFSVGISGPKDWLKEQKRKAAKYLLAPIDASRENLRSVYLALTAGGSDLTVVDLGEVQKLLVSSARDCVPRERNSFVVFQANTGVEVCTFTLILKNAASLLDKNDPVKLEGEAILNNLISSFASLSGVINGMDIQLSSDRLKVADAVMDTLSSLDKFEQGVKDCLEA